MKTKILQILRQSGDYVSGQELCDSLGVSRTAVWKAIKQLREKGYEIEAVQNRGYRLAAVPDVLSQQEIESLIRTKWLGHEVFYYEEIDSTNTEAKRKAEEGAPHGTLVVADMQKAGRGRRGRSWSSPHNQGIFFTILLRPEIEPANAPMLTLVKAIAVARGISKITGLKAQIKWPNDVVINGKKVVGILTEMSAQIDYVNHIVVGTGINVHQTSFPEELADKATSIDLELKNAGKTGTVSRAQLLEEILEQFEECYETYIRTQDLSGLIEEYNHTLVNIGRRVKVLDPLGEFEGRALGINKHGSLLVEREDGEVTEVSSGEVSVRGIYGYV